MSIKPLDLQVNINSLFEISRHEGDRRAKESDQMRQMDEKTIQEALKKNERVEKSAQSTDSNKTKGTEDHFGAKTKLEQIEEQYRDSHKPPDHSNSEQKTFTEQKSEPESEKKQNDDGEHKINLLA